LKSLVVTADDFGAAVEVNEAVEVAHRDGVLTAASLMVAAPASADAVARAKSMPNLRVGLHLVLVEGRPILSPNAVPDLVGRDGNFRTDMARAGASIFFRPSVRRQVAHEITAQFEAFAATGLALDHANAHKHFHLHPTIGRLMIEIGARFGLRAARVPQEAFDVIGRVDGRRTKRPDVLAPFCAMLRSRLRAAGLTAPDRVIGLTWSGAMSSQRLCGAIANLSEGLTEIYLHPAVRDVFPGAVPFYRYKQEFEALLDSAVLAAARDGSIRMGGFADFVPRR
jgi:hopanoid biosynthesis associated protein HpnK